jgi:hypothetical protein
VPSSFHLLLLLSLLLFCRRWSVCCVRCACINTYQINKIARRHQLRHTTQTACHTAIRGQMTGYTNVNDSQRVERRA